MSACVSRELAEEERQKADRLNHERKDNGVGGKRTTGGKDNGTTREKDNGVGGKRQRGNRQRGKRQREKRQRGKGDSYEEQPLKERIRVRREKKVNKLWEVRQGS